MTELHDHDARREALANFDDNLVLVAGAGSGKTSLMVSRVLCALVGRRIDPEEILVTTFTEKAAAEMAERLDEALRALCEVEGPDASDAGRARAALRDEHGLSDEDIARIARDISEIGVPSVETFHAYCLRWLREFARSAELPPDVDIVIGVDERRVFEEFWPTFLHAELGKRSYDARVDRAWDVLLDHFEVRELCDLARAWCLEPQFRACRIDWSRDGLVRASRELVECFAQDPMIDAAAHKFEAWIQRACALTERFLAVEGEVVDSRLQEDALELLDESSGTPGKTAYPDEDLRAGAKDDGKRLRAQLMAWTQLPAPALSEAIDVFVARAADAFAVHCSETGQLSFSDCLVRCEALLRKQARLRARLRDRYAMLIVDEFQDTDPLQYEILFFLAQAGPTSAEDDPYAIPLEAGKLCIVGDPKQSIYRFRGADMRAYRRAIDHIVSRGGRVLGLDVNFRSEAEILSFVNASIGPDFLAADADADAQIYQALRQDLHAPRATRGAGKTLFLEIDASGEDKKDRCAREARELGRWISERIRTRAHDKVSYRDFALLFRAATEIETYARELRALGLPVLVEGGKRFYQRREIERLVALLRLALCPWDATAALSCLRGPLGAVPDAELFRVAELSRERDEIPAPTQWLMLGHTDDELAPELSRASRTLRAHAHAISERNVDAALDYALYETGLASIEAAGWDGAQRLANVEALAQRVSAWARRGARDLTAAVDHLEREASEQADAEESPLADAHSDAVRLMTIHKSKGLEWDTVLIPEIRRALKPGRSPALFTLDRRRPRTALCALEGARSPELPTHTLEEQLHENAELARLCYVAATRAKTELVLSWATPAASGKSLWHSVALRSGISFSQRQESSVVEPAEHRCVPAEEDESRDHEYVRAAPAYRLDSSGLRAREAHERDTADSLRPGIGAPSASHGVPSASDSVTAATEARQAGAGGATRRKSAAATIGAVVHEMLALGIERDGDIDEAHVRALVAQHTRTRWSDRRHLRRVEQECSEILRATLDSSLGDELRTRPILGRELPVAWVDAEQARWHGSIDLVLERDGAVTIVDYKTDVVRSGDESAFVERHAAQLRLYADGLQRAWHLETSPRCELWLLRRQERFTVEA